MDIQTPLLYLKHSPEVSNETTFTRIVTDMSKSITKTPKKVTDSPDHITKVLAILTKVDSQRLKPEAAVKEIKKVFAELYAPVVTPGYKHLD